MHLDCSLTLLGRQRCSNPTHSITVSYHRSLTGGVAVHGPGIVNVVMAAAPLLKQHARALLLTSYLATVQEKHLFEGTADFYEKLLCMSAHTASLLLGQRAQRWLWSPVSYVAGQPACRPRLDGALAG